jgi:hypothetical protein
MLFTNVDPGDIKTLTSRMLHTTGTSANRGGPVFMRVGEANQLLECQSCCLDASCRGLESLGSGNAVSLPTSEFPLQKRR